jgi:hypothetical protein
VARNIPAELTSGTSSRPPGIEGEIARLRSPVAALDRNEGSSAVVGAEVAAVLT